MSISIVVPAYNEEKYIGVLLDSFVKQDYRDFEVIVVDGQSTDKTKDVVARFKDQLDLRFVASPTKGVSFQRNYGADLAKHEQLLFIDSDGYIGPDFLTKIVAYLVKNPDTDMFSTWALPLTKKRIYSTFFIFYNILFIDLMKNIKPFIALGGFLFAKKSVFKALGGYSIKHAVVEDLDLVERAFKAGYKLDILRKPVFYTSVRRLEKEGVAKMAINLSRATLYKYINGEISEDLMKNKKIKYDMDGGSHYEVE
jgi:glycosyltransferase involved in cell wall biosynthesis